VVENDLLNPMGDCAVICRCLRFNDFPNLWVKARPNGGKLAPFALGVLI